MFTNMQRLLCYVISYFCIGCRIVNLVTADGCVHIAESVGSRRELVANLCTHGRRRRDTNRQFRRVGGVYWALLNVNYLSPSVYVNKSSALKLH